MPTIAAPVIIREMNDWVAIGGGNSGIVGNAAHDYGFHIGARFLPRTDYSLWRDPNGADGPFINWDYACAGDFSHKNSEKLRVHHRRVLNGLMNGEYPMICEFIGKPWADRPVYYWARWNGIQTLQWYTGAGHDHWSHISWYRSKVNQRAGLWIPKQSTPPEEEDVSYDKWSKTAKEQLAADLRRALFTDNKSAGKGETLELWGRSETDVFTWIRRAANEGRRSRHLLAALPNVIREVLHDVVPGLPDEKLHAVVEQMMARVRLTVTDDTSE